VSTGEIERLVGNLGFWSIHLLRVSFFVLTALASGLFLVRIGLSKLVGAESSPAGADIALPPRRLTLSALLAFVACLTAGFFAVRPDEHFHLTIADTAYAGGDYARAAVYYEPVVAWGTPRADVYVRFGFCELKLRRYRGAARSFERAVALDPARRKDTGELAALAHLGLGEPAVAVLHLQDAVALADDPAEKARLAGLLAQVQGSRP
jgi:tetratricopeptide (TPR) repeat protein